MFKFVFFSFIFHLSLLVAFKLEIIDLKKNEQQAINVNLSLEKKIIEEKPKKKVRSDKSAREKEKPKKKVKSDRSVKEKEKQKKDMKSLKPIIEKSKKEIKSNKPPKEKKEKSSSKDEFDDLLKDLAKKKLPLETQDSFDKKLQKLSEQKLKNSNNLNKKILNQNELNNIEKLILNQIDENWSRPPGIKTTKDLIIKMIVRLDINGNVIELKIHKSTMNEINRNNILQPYLDSAIRAIKKASPFEGLKKDRYNKWKELIINFKPIEAR